MSMGSKFRNFILSLLGFILAGVVILFSVLLHQTYQEYQAFTAREAQLYSRLQQLQEENRSKQIYMEKLLNDPEFLERVVRERLGYSRPDDLLYRFPEK